MKAKNQNEVNKIFEHFKGHNESRYNEEVHCKLLLDVMLDYERGTLGDFCIEAMVCEATFYKWLRQNELFQQIYYFSQLLNRKVWEKEGFKLKDVVLERGETDLNFEHWKMIGWSRFGYGRNGRVKLKLNPISSPTEHYAQILEQAREGDFTTSEIKQLMEAVNVGLNTHEKLELQKQINELKSNLELLATNSNAKNPITNK